MKIGRVENPYYTSRGWYWARLNLCCIAFIDCWIASLNPFTKAFLCTSSFRLFIWLISHPEHCWTVRGLTIIVLLFQLNIAWISWVFLIAVNRYQALSPHDCQYMYLHKIRIVFHCLIREKSNTLLTTDTQTTMKKGTSVIFTRE